MMWKGGDLRAHHRTHDLAPLLKARYGQAVRKLCLRIGATCPNRDGTVGFGGCIFCTDSIDASPPLEEQLRQGLRGGQPFIAYLQDRSATHLPARTLDRVLEHLVAVPQIVAITIGTRPDCLGHEILDVLAARRQQKEILVELGLQSADDRTLAFVRRMHTVADFSRAVRDLHRLALRVCAHVILGLPTPSDGGDLVVESADHAVRTAQLLASLEVEAVKVHNCHVLQGTPLGELFAGGRYAPPDLAGYLERLIPFLEHLPPSVEIHRLLAEARPPLLVAPAFSSHKSHALSQIRAALEARDTWQGRLWTGSDDA
jgi:uncharacterized protein